MPTDSGPTPVSPAPGNNTLLCAQTLEAQRHLLYLARQQRLRERIHKAALPVRLTLDVNHVF